MRHYGIIGYPLHHSFSAKFFNEKFEREQIEAEYSLYPTPAESLPEKFEHLLSTLDGMNVTLPYKQAVIPYLDQLLQGLLEGRYRPQHERLRRADALVEGLPLG